ncbi:hypothetical protein ACOMHN_031967 [Nucella lapillus]
MILETKKMADDGSESCSYDFTDIADAIIITNLNTEFFDDDSAKENFEMIFRNYDLHASFNYLKSFRRARVNFSSPEATVAARLERNNTEICGQLVNCYFARMPKTLCQGGLLPPKPEKMFLISPPSSPPVGWEQQPESGPTINHDLIEALSRLSPDTDGPALSGGTHELQPASDHLPGIVVHICEDPEGYANRPAMIQTQRPGRLN